MLAGTIATLTNGDVGDVDLRSIEKPVSSDELSCQVKLIRVAVAVVDVKAVGAFGIVTQLKLACQPVLVLLSLL